MRSLVYAVALLFADPQKPATELPKELADKATASTDPLSVVVFTAILTGCFLIFVLSVLALIAWRAGGRFDDAPRTQQLFGMTLVLGIAATLLIAGFGATQLAAFSGLFGAALGYLFGKGSRRPPQEPKT